MELARALGVSKPTLERMVRTKLNGFPKLYRISPGRRGFRHDEAVAYLTSLPTV
jgi:hypothetical protein